jgi:hypothetical protein
LDASTASNTSVSLASNLFSSVIKINLNMADLQSSRSQWPRGLRHDPSSPPRKLGSWVRISLEAWMFVCVRLFCVRVFLCLGSGLATG